MPDVSFELSQIDENLEGIIVNAGPVSESMAPIGTPLPEAEHIMQEADTLAELKLKSIPRTTLATSSDRIDLRWHSTLCCFFGLPSKSQ